MASIDSDDGSLFSTYSPGDDDGRNNKQAQSSQKDMFEDDTDSDIDEPEKKPATLKKKVHLLPAVAVPEKIIFCIDTTADTGNGYLFEDAQQSPDTQSVRNEAIRVFVTNKLSIARDTEFALLSLTPGKAELVSPLSSNVDQFISRLAGLKSVLVGQSDEYDITSMFSIVRNIIDIPQEPRTTVIPPNYIVRLILIYGHSFLEPSVNVTNEFYKNFMLSPFCLLDVFYLHDKQTDINNVEEIFKCFVKITSEKSYLLENARNVTTLFNKMSKLLAHPCQRVAQDMWSY